MIDILNLLFFKIFYLINNYGFSIIIYSLTLNLLLIPIYFIVENITEKTNVIKQSISPQIEKINRISNIKERYYYKLEIYKKNNLKQYNLFSHLFNFFIQVPFLIGTYFLFEKNIDFSGEKFFMINELSEPDGLFSLFSFRLNFLPLLMTLLSSITSFIIYKKNKKEFKQSLVINLMFLLLLYNQPAALLIFWTTNLLFTILLQTSFRIIKLKDWKIIHFQTIFSLIFRKYRVFLKKLKYYIIAYLSSILPYLYLFEKNFFFINNGNHFILLIFFLLVSIFTIYSLEKIFNNYHKSLFVHYLILLVFYSYNYFEEILMIRHRYLILIDFIIIILSIVLVRRFLPPNKIFIKFLNTVISVFSILLIFKILVFTVTISDKIKSQQFLKVNNFKNKKFPDIYFIVLDGYSNHNILKESFDFDNSNHLNYLLKKGFYIDSISRTNYFLTDLSLNSTLNGRYLNSNIINSVNRNVTFLKKSTNNSFVFNYLKNKNYTVINLDGSKGPLSDNLYNDYNFFFKKRYLSRYFVDDFTRPILLKTMIKPIILKFFSNYDSYFSILYQLDKITDLESIESPKFVMSHIVSPHPPYVFSENGKPKYSGFNQNNWKIENKKDYIDQIKFLNTKIKFIVDNILKKNTNSIIVIQSDHGSSFSSDPREWDDGDFNLIKERSAVINYVYIPGYRYEKYYQGSTLVNTFPLLFNTVFNEKLKILKDSTFFSNYSSPFKFTDITKISDSLISNHNP
jgi:hypothetical protein